MAAKAHTPSHAGKELRRHSQAISAGRAARCAEVPILVVDSDYGFLSGVSANLQDDGHPVVGRHSPMFVPPLDNLSSVAAVLMDYPGFAADWLRFARRFHRRFPEVPIVLATAEHSPALERAAADLCVIVHKPIGYDELHEMLHVLVERRERRGDRSG